MTIYTIILIILAALAFWVVAIYNSLIRLRNRAVEAWSNINVQLKRRYDLIPNLVEAVKGYMAHERQVFEKVTEARSRAMNAAPGEKAGAENMLTNALKSLFAVAENYPQLRASDNFRKMQDDFTDTENKVQAARNSYNTSVRDLNIKIETFPTNLMAHLFGFQQMEFFGDLEESERSPVKVKF